MSRRARSHTGTHAEFSLPRMQRNTQQHTSTTEDAKWAGRHRAGPVAHAALKVPRAKHNTHETDDAKTTGEEPNYIRGLSCYATPKYHMFKSTSASPMWYHFWRTSWRTAVCLEPQSPSSGAGSGGSGRSVARRPQECAPPADAGARKGRKASGGYHGR